MNSVLDCTGKKNLQFPSNNCLTYHMLSGAATRMKIRILKLG